jgi:hypothetical protein
VKQNTQVSLPQSGSNGTAPWLYCNITTVYDPNHLSLVVDKQMTKRGSTFNYTLSNSYTTALGIYIVEGVCGDGNYYEPFAYSFEVTTTGNKSSISLWISIILMLVSVVFLILSLMLDNRYMGFITGILFIVSGLYIMIYGFGSMADMYTRTVGIVLLGVGLIVFFISAFNNYNDSEDEGFKKIFGIDKKEEEDETDYFNKNGDRD